VVLIGFSFNGRISFKLVARERRNIVDGWYNHQNIIIIPSCSTLINSAAIVEGKSHHRLADTAAHQLYSRKQ
jgi:hypothetical protein